MRAAISLFITCGMALAAPPLAAQEDEATRPEPAGERAAGEKKEPGGEEPPPSPERFDPSEEISLDLPVSFPVDI